MFGETCAKLESSVRRNRGDVVRELESNVLRRDDVLEMVRAN